MKTFFALLLLTLTFLAQGKETKNIVVIHSYPAGEWQNGISKGLESTLRSSSHHFKFEHMLYDYEKLKFKGLKEQEERVLQILREISRISPDYIVINDDEAIAKVLPKLKTHAHVILNGVNDDPENTSWGKANDLSHRCGVIEHYPLSQSLKMISLMAPKIKSMSVISSTGDSSKIVARIFRKLTAQQLQNIRLRKVSLESSWEKWKSELLEMNKHDGIGWILVPYEVVDANGRAIPLNEMASWIKNNISIPMLGILSVHTKMGFLSAISVEPFGLGKQSAEIIARIEKGQSCKSIGFEKSKYHNFEINTDELKRFGFKVPDRFIGVAKFVKTDTEISK